MIISNKMDDFSGKLYGFMNKQRRFDFDKNRNLKLYFSIFFMILSVISITIFMIIFNTPINQIYNQEKNDYFITNLITFSCFIPAFFVLSYMKWISWQYFISN